MCFFFSGTHCIYTPYLGFGIPVTIENIYYKKHPFPGFPLEIFPRLYGPKYIFPLPRNAAPLCIQLGGTHIIK